MCSLEYGCRVECRATAKVSLTRSHQICRAIASDNVEKGSVVTEKGSGGKDNREE